MGLSDTTVRNTKPDPNKTIKLSDGEGLQLWVRPSGAKTWALAYRFGGLQKKLTIGRYPAIGLRDARRHKDEAKAFLAQGIDPGTRQMLIRQEQEAIRANTFESVADEVVAKKRREGRSLSGDSLGRRQDSMWEAASKSRSQHLPDSLALVS